MYEGAKDGRERTEEGQLQICRQQPQGEQQQQQLLQQQWWERQPEALMHPSLVELCFHRNNPTLQTQTYLKAFHQMLGEGLLDRFKTIHILYVFDEPVLFIVSSLMALFTSLCFHRKYWQTMSLIAGSDVSLGMTAKIGEAFDITTEVRVFNPSLPYLLLSVFPSLACLDHLCAPSSSSFPPSLPA